MKSKLISIREASKKLGVSIDTLRRWDKTNKLKSIRLTQKGHRYYNLEELDLLSEDIFSKAKNWILEKNPEEPESNLYYSNASLFQSKIGQLENELKKLSDMQENFSLLSAIAGEIGNNSFDHNIGSWRDIRGIFFAYDINKRQIVLADRGQGIFTTLKRVKPALLSDKDALVTAFSEKISGRAPEARGNGLKFVRKIITQENNTTDMKLYFQSGKAILNLQKGDSELNISESKINLEGCLAFINF